MAFQEWTTKKEKEKWSRREMFVTRSLRSFERKHKVAVDGDDKEQREHGRNLLVLFHLSPSCCSG